ncbi:MAG: hypothetical protein HQM12_21145 [SAR324 cluster bacterium]|nr:hypothetical protein [SAR324 cluster bacterium]MBF0350404.1 hypothetical protein [SAR324 cluster bacterium]
MSKNKFPGSFITLSAERVAEYFSKEWHKFQNGLSRIYREDLDPLHPQGNEALPFYLSHPKVQGTVKMFNKTLKKAQQRLSKGNPHIRDHTSTTSKKHQD